MILYRCSKVCYSEELSIDEIGFHYAEYKVIKETPKGYWLYISYGKKKFIMKDAKKQWASPTKKEALQHFLCRAKSSVRIMNWQIGFTKLAIQKANDLLK